MEEHGASSETSVVSQTSVENKRKCYFQLVSQSVQTADVHAIDTSLSGKSGLDVDSKTGFWRVFVVFTWIRSRMDNWLVSFFSEWDPFLVGLYHTMDRIVRENNVPIICIDNCYSGTDVGLLPSQERDAGTPQQPLHQHKNKCWDQPMFNIDKLPLVNPHFPPVSVMEYHGPFLQWSESL